MTFFNKRRRFRNDSAGRRPERSAGPSAGHPDATGLEASYLKSLIDARSTVTVVLTTGERLRGRIRYYDADTFSLGTANGGPKLFLRKESVSYIAEE